MAIFCRNCGTCLTDDAKFCAACGTPTTPVSQPQSNAQPQQTYQQTYDQPQQTYQQTYDQPQQTYQQTYDQPQQTYHQAYTQPQQTYQQTYVQPQQTYQQTYVQPQPYSAQLAQQAYWENMQRQQAAYAASMKPKRYIPLRIILILICGVLVFFAWKYGLRNIRMAQIGGNSFMEAVAEGEDAEALQAAYDRSSDAPPQEPRVREPVHDLYDWFYRDGAVNAQGGATQ